MRAQPDQLKRQNPQAEVKKVKVSRRLISLTSRGRWSAERPVKPDETLILNFLVVFQTSHHMTQKGRRKRGTSVGTGRL